MTTACPHCNMNSPTVIPSFIHSFPNPISIKRPTSTITKFKPTICTLKHDSPHSPTSSLSFSSLAKLIPFPLSSPSPKAVSAILASIFIFSTSFSSPVHAKNLLSDNTIFRRYLVTDSAAVLRYSLPLPSDPSPIPIRLIQDCLEKLGVHQRSSGVASLISSRTDISNLQKLLIQRQLDVLLDVPAKYRQQAANQLTKLEQTVEQLRQEIGESGPVIGESFLPDRAVKAQQTLRDAFTPRNTMKQISNYDAAYLESLRLKALESVSEIEQLVVNESGPAFRIPRRYNEYPRLLGRAQVQFTLEKKQNEKWINETTKQPTDDRQVTLIATIDGYSAPLTSGNFIDLTQRGVYSNTNVISSQKGFYVQLKPTSTEKQQRQIPLEILPQDEPSPIYGRTLDEAGIGDLQPTLPVSAFGALCMYHSIEDPNDASSQFYMFTLDPTSYQARSVGGSILTGSVATFGYVTEGKQFLSQLQAGDRIVSAKVISGLQHFKQDGNR